MELRWYAVEDAEVSAEEMASSLTNRLCHAAIMAAAAAGQAAAGGTHSAEHWHPRPDIDDAVIIPPAFGCQQLRRPTALSSLCLYNCRLQGITQGQLAAALQALTNLTSLTLVGVQTLQEATPEPAAVAAMDGDDVDDVAAADAAAVGVQGEAGAAVSFNLHAEAASIAHAVGRLGQLKKLVFGVPLSNAAAVQVASFSVGELPQLQALQLLHTDLSDSGFISIIQQFTAILRYLMKS
eukprot:gene4679-4932_t